MSKLELAKQSIQWKIESENNSLEEAIRRICREMEEKPMMVNTVTLQHAAFDIAEAQTKLRMLQEELKMLDALYSEQ